MIKLREKIKREKSPYLQMCCQIERIPPKIRNSEQDGQIVGRYLPATPRNKQRKKKTSASSELILQVYRPLHRTIGPEIDDPRRVSSF